MISIPPRYKTSAKRRARRSAFSREREKKKRSIAMPTLTFSRFENRILTIIPCPTQRVLNCSSRCSPPLELRSRSIASRLARSRVRRRTRPIVARLAFWFDDGSIDFLLLLFFRCVCWCVVVVEKQALFVSFGMKKKKKEEEPKQKNDEKQTKREKPKFFRNWWTNFIILTNVNTSHLQTRRTYSIYYSRNSKYLFFARFFSRKYSHIVRRPLSRMPYIVWCARKYSRAKINGSIVWTKNLSLSKMRKIRHRVLFFSCATKQQKHKKREESKQTNKKQKIAKKTDGETTPLDKKH